MRLELGLDREGEHLQTQYISMSCLPGLQGANQAYKRSENCPKSRYGWTFGDLL